MKNKNFFHNDYISESSRDFIEETKLNTLNIMDYATHINAIMNSPYYMNEIANHTIELGNVKTISLSPINNSSNDDANILREINTNRKSIRTYKNEALTLNELSELLQNAFFISEKNGNKKRKNIASPGALYPVELYYINLKATDELNVGAYYYDENTLKLKLVSTSEEKEFMKAVYDAFDVDNKADIDIKSSSGIIILGTTLNRVTFKYLDRGIRWAFTEAGAITHCLQLSATANKTIGTCACAGFYDDLVSELIGYKSNDQLPIISLVVGKI